MGEGCPRGCRWTRRAVMAGLIGASLPVLGEQGTVYPPDIEQYLDPATEFPVVRLTSPSYSSFLPASAPAALGRGGDFLTYCSDRSGRWQAYRMDFKTGESRALTAAAELDRETLALVGGERSVCYFDGVSLRQTFLSNLRTRQLYRMPEGWMRGPGFSVSIDGLHAAFIERREQNWRLRLLDLARGTAATLVEAQEPLALPALRPRRAGVLYRRRQDELWLVHYDGQQNRRLKTAPGPLTQAHWSSDGRSVYYLAGAGGERKLSEIREHVPDTNADALIGATSQFASFSANRDGSVFAGASGSKASPYILILLRVTRRELTLCEHRSSDPAAVAPVFSANSQRVYFGSDRHGKPAIYMIRLDRFVERTET